MFQRTLYATLVGVSAVAALLGAFLPWAEIRFDADEFSKSGTEGAVGSYIVLLSLALASLVLWFWLDQHRGRIRLYSFLMFSVAALLVGISTFGFAGIDTLLELPSYPDEKIVLREGVYLTGAVGALGCLVSLAALLFYDPHQDRPAPTLQAAALASFLVLPGALYLFIAAWTALDLPFPRLAVSLGGYEVMTLNIGRFVPQNDFRSVDLTFAIVLPALGLVAGLLTSLGRTRVRLAAAASGVIIVIYLFVLATEGWWAALPCRPSCLLFTDESPGSAGDTFRAAVVFYAIVAGAMILSLCTGLGLTGLVRAAAGTRRGRAAPMAPA